MKIQIAVISTTLAMLVIFAGCKGEESTSQPNEPNRPEDRTTAEKAPNFSLQTHDGKTVALDDYTGKIVVLEWFNYDCPYVKYHYQQKNTMIDLAQKYAPKGIVWLAVNSTSQATKEKNKAFAQKHNLPYPILDDSSGDVGRAYGAKRTPHMFVIDSKGYIRYQGAIDNAPLGETDNSLTNYVDKALTQLIKGEKVTTPKTKPYGCTVKY